MARASSGAGRADEPRMSSTRMALPAPFIRAIVRPASRWDEAKPLIPLGGSRARRPTQTGRPIDRPRAEPRDGLAQAVILDRRGGGARSGFRCVGGNRGGTALFLERRHRTLPEGNLVDASPAQMRVHP